MERRRKKRLGLSFKERLEKFFLYDITELTTGEVDSEGEPITQPIFDPEENFDLEVFKYMKAFKLSYNQVMKEPARTFRRNLQFLDLIDERDKLKLDKTKSEIKNKRNG